MPFVPTTLDNIFNSIAQAAAQAPQATAVVPSLTDAAFDGTIIAPSASFKLPVAPLTKSLYAYQLGAVETILAHPKAILGYQPGMGKTAILQAVVAAKAAQGERSICVVPPSLRISPWAEDFAADFPHLKVVMVEGMAPCKTCGQANASKVHGTKKVKGDHNFEAGTKPIEDADVIIVGDSLIQSRLQDLMDFGATTITMDEGHRYKNRTAKRTIATLALCDQPTVTTAVMATGTLSVNHAGDVYSPLRITGADNAKAVSGGASWTIFMDRWCDTEMVWTGRTMVKVVTGCQDPAGLRERLLKTCMISVPREDVLDLPERTFAVRNLALNGDAAAYRRMEKDFLAWVRDTQGDEAFKRAKKAEAVVKMMKLWEADGLAKVSATVEYVEAMVEQGEQVVMMAWHTKVIQALYSALRAKKITVSTIIGGMSGQAKADTVNKFQAGETQVVIGQIAAAGTGLTLHKSCNIVFAQLPWSPAAFAQASDRVYRIGQHNNVTVHILNGVGMVSQNLWMVLQNKAAVVDAINTGTESTIEFESIQEAVLSSFGW
jgi:SNF2 family DNA or RNA helicase